MRGLLDDELLDGAHEVTTLLRPKRCARPVAVNDMRGLLKEIEWLCQVWGGAGQPVIPVDNGQVSARYGRLLQTEQVDCVGGLQDLDVVTPRGVERGRAWDHPALLIASGEPLERWRPVHVAELAAEDPWKLIYAATLGTWPEVPEHDLLELAGLRQDLRFEEIVPVERQQVEGSLGDLLARLTDDGHLSPRQLSNMFMAAGLEPDTSFMADDEIIPQPWAIRRAAGPNVIVAVADGSVEDVALLWNMRAGHGDRRVLPLGLPAADVTADALDELQQPGRATMFGLSGGNCYLTSASLEFAELEDLAALSSTVVPARYEDLLTLGPAPGRPRSQVVLWTDGRARLDPLSDGDREVLRPTHAALRGPSLVLDVHVDGYCLPADGGMRGHEFGLRFQAGAAQVHVAAPRREGTVRVIWPPSWTCLAAVAQGRGLKVAPSDGGLAAVTLIRALGSLDAVRWLQHQPLIDLLYRLSERSGMAWWKQRWTRTHEQLIAAVNADPAELDTAAKQLGRDELVVAPAGEGRDLPFDEFRTTFGGDTAARRWVAWAERTHLLVRGTKVTCPDCSTTSWLPMASLPPPVGCLGCGREIQQPYGARDLLFTYRIGEPLRRVLETDSLGHVLALHWFTQLFDRHGLVGAHPGVNFVDRVTGETVGEADVLLLFADGSLAPVEVKRRCAGLEGRAVELMDKLSESLSAPYDVVVVTQPARDCASLEALGRRLPDRPRLLLTNDQLHEHRVVWTVGRDPFGWNPRTAEQDAHREASFAERLTKNDPETVRDWASATLLGDVD